MMMDGYDGQMIFGDPLGLNLPDIHLTGEEKHRKNLTQETCPDRGSNPGPLRDKRTAVGLIDFIILRRNVKVTKWRFFIFPLTLNFCYFNNKLFKPKAN